MSALVETVRAAATEAGAQVVDWDGSVIVLTLGSGHPHVSLDLDRLGMALRGVTDPAPLVDARVRAALRAADSSRDLDVTQVLPHLRPAGDSGPWTRSIVPGHLARALIVDGASTMRYLTPMDVVQAGVSLAALDVQAEVNLVLASPEGCIHHNTDLGPDVWVVRVGDGHDAARALIVERLFPQAERVLLLIPTRDHLWVVTLPGESGRRVAAGLRPIARAVARASAYPLSDAVFISERGVLAEFSPAVP